MKVTPLRVILGLNLVVIAMIYGLIPKDSAGYQIILWAFATLAQLAVNGILLVAAGLLMLMPGMVERLKNVAAAFGISMGLVLLISFPLCFVMSAIR